MAMPPDGAGTTPPDPGVILATKLAVPALRQQLITRAELVRTLSAGHDHKVTLLDAPAGWGKTTLLAQWAAQERAKVAWLSLDPADNDPARFWTYVVTALQEACPALSTRAVSLLEVHADPEQVVLPTLLNDLARLQDNLVLVVDDYHVLSNGTIHEAMTFFIERMPGSLRLVLATRSDPPLPLARLRARGQLLELRAGDLRFVAGEAGRLLNDALGLGLADEDVGLLWQRTEGWAAGLYLAALSLEGRPDAASFIKAFAGDHRHIVDYLSAEVLDGQPPELRRFLYRTSVLDRLSGPLCDAVLDSPGSAAVLEAIERDNLFLTPLDSSRLWYRYHQLFAELLRNELRRTEPALTPALHRRAAQWFRAEGFTDEAVRHLIAAADAADVAGAAELVAARWGREYNRGRLSTVSAWLDLLPEPTVTADPRLCLVRAWIALDMRWLSDAARWIDAAEAGLAARPAGTAGPDTLAAEITVLRAVQLFKIGNVTEAVAVAGRATGLDLGDVPLGQSAAYSVYGAALYWSGRVPEARTAFARAVQLADQVANYLGRTYATGYLAVISAERGQLSEADQLIRRAAAADRDVAAGEHFVDMMPALAMAKVLDQRGETAPARDAAQRALVLAQRGGGKLEVLHALLVHAELLRKVGHGKLARAGVAEARAWLRDCPDPSVARQLLTAAESHVAEGAAPGVGHHTVAHGLAEELTSKELQLLRLLSAPISRREISARLFVSLNTVKTHQRSLYRKLQVSDRDKAVERAKDLGLL